MDRIRLIVFAVLASVILTVSVSAASGNQVAEEYQIDVYRARILELVEEEDFGGIIMQTFKIRILNKGHRSLETTIEHMLIGNDSDVNLKAGDRITVVMTLDHENNPTFFFHGWDRTAALAMLFGLFLLCIVVFGRIKGLRAIIALTLTILLVLFGLVPVLLRGYDPIIMSIIACVISALITFFICFGINMKSFAGLIGVAGGLIIAGIIAHLFAIFAKIAGVSHSDAQMLQYLGHSFDFRGLLFAGIIIGASGACTDVAISISSALTELKSHKPDIGKKEIIESGFNIGKDIMGSMVDTLVLAYTGASLTTILILVGFEKSFGEIINLDTMATEILRAVAGSIGLIFAIPVTVFAFILLDSKFGKKTKTVKEVKAHEKL
jgi:uncharacterized membrane protein